ncbi:MAG: tetratricopeptide repeat protein, partial [Oligoflexales bacterium]|nr:tetratricopeptide repeat protein [Oligoflexales bacterium]
GIFCFIFCSLTACFSTSPSKKQEGVSKLDEIIELDPKSSEKNPASFWSPATRKLNARYYFLVAEYEGLKGNISISRQLMEKAYNLESNALLAIKMIETEAKTGAVDKALQQCRKIVLLYPQTSEVHTLYGRLLANQGLFEKSIFHFERAIELSPTKIDPYLGLIELHKQQRNLGNAIAVAEDLVHVDPSFIDGWGILARLYLSSSDKKRALRPAKRAYDLQGQNPENVLTYALALELNGESRQAVQLYEILFRLDPANEELTRRMVELYHQIGDLNDALALLKEAESNGKGKRPGLKVQQAFILWELQRYEEASKILENLAEEYPDSDRILYMTALGQEKVNKYDSALNTYSRIPEFSQYKVHADYRSIKILELQKKYEEAISYAKRVASGGGEKATEFYIVASEILWQIEKVGDAIQLLKEGVRTYPENINLLFVLGVNYERNGEIDNCVKTMKEVIQKDPSNSAAYNYLGYLYADRGEKLKEAEELIRKALELKPGDGFYLDSLGWVYFKKKMYDEALEFFNKADKIVPGEGVILEHIGDVYIAKKDEKTGLDYYRKALKGRCEKRDMDRIEKKLKRIEK